MQRALYVIYQQFTDRLQDDALRALRRVHATTFPALRLRVVVVDNVISAPDAVPLADDVTRLAGDNSAREFSGLDRGWMWTLAQHAPADDDVVCLCNETFLKDAEVADLFGIDAAFAARHLSQHALIGHVDSLGFSFRALGVELSEWVRSDFVLLTVRTLKRVAPLTLQLADEALFVDDPARFFRTRDDTSAEYLAFISDFLQGRPNETLWRWHSAQRFDRTNVALFRLKARAILTEHQFSARAQAAGASLVDLSPARWPSKMMRHRLRRWFFRTGLWRLIPRFRARFSL